MATREGVQADLESLRELEALRLHAAQEHYREVMNVYDRLWTGLLKEDPPASRLTAIATKGRANGQMPLAGQLSEVAS